MSKQPSLMSTPDRRAVVGAGGVDGVVRQVGPGVAGRGGMDDALAGRPLHGAVDRLLRGGLVGLVGAVVHERVDVVAVVGHVHALEPGPHEAADGVLGVDEAVVVDDLHRCHAGVGGDPDDADAVAGGGDGAGDVGSVVAGRRVPPGRGAVDPAGVGAVHRVLGVDVGREVGVVGVDAAVEDADHDVARAVADLVSLVGLDDLHVPLLALTRVGDDVLGGGVGELSLGAAPGELGVREAGGGAGGALLDRDRPGCADGGDVVATLLGDVGAEGRRWWSGRRRRRSGATAATTSPSARPIARRTSLNCWSLTLRTLTT